ncbi:hypothetical protein Hanom_Chr10g00919831 [Helianthus anomalus]
MEPTRMQGLCGIRKLDVHVVLGLLGPYHFSYCALVISYNCCAMSNRWIVMLLSHLPRI